jgi:hypothetical protein
VLYPVLVGQDQGAQYSASRADGDRVNGREAHAKESEEGARFQRVCTCPVRPSTGPGSAKSVVCVERSTRDLGGPSRSCRRGQVSHPDKGR